jgi:choline dehydrogenase
VTKILVHNSKAIGIEYFCGGKKLFCYARREVILSAGTLQSPHLLMLSGIGPAAMLREHSLDVVVDLPGVGQNLQDHLEFYMQYECKQPITLNRLKNPIRRIGAGMQWFLANSGACATSHLEAGAFIKSRADVSHPDLQYHFLPGVVNNHGRDLGKAHAFQVHVGTMRPESRGYLRLASRNPLTPIKVHANYLQAESDLRDLMAAVPLTRDIFQQASFKPFRGKEIQPGIDYQNPHEIARFVKQKADSAYHPCGTCKMGTDLMAVVNPEAKVYGIENLRVVDASIMPSIISGNLNAPTIMLAERVSDMILSGSKIQ